MASPSSKSYSLQVAERLNGTTQKDQLGKICLGGLSLELIWHSVVETRFIKTPPAAVRKAMIRAVIVWPGLYIVTGAALKWAEWKVGKVEQKDFRNQRAS
ncbi:hypothetical protein GGR52DRAFT_48771 [Hypoxylon sp. FL1284]|nr:hypothetical protein GGR52DRAFT_48771 [Hypoxylon sp. FL1284]